MLCCQQHCAYALPCAHRFARNHGLLLVHTCSVARCRQVVRRSLRGLGRPLRRCTLLFKHRTRAHKVITQPLHLCVWTVAALQVVAVTELQKVTERTSPRLDVKWTKDDLSASSAPTMELGCGRIVAGSLTEANSQLLYATSST